MPVAPKKVFVIHGRNLKARDELFAFLVEIGLSPITWDDAILLTGKTAPFIGEILDSAFVNAQAAIVLLTGDDEVRLKREFQTPNDGTYEKYLTPQPRPNVLFEAGMAFAWHPERTILVELGILRPFSDVLGRHTIKLDNTPQKRGELVRRLELAGCNVRLRRNNKWLFVGDFSI